MPDAENTAVPDFEIEDKVPATEDANDDTDEREEEDEATPGNA